MKALLLAIALWWAPAPPAALPAPGYPNSLRLAPTWYMNYRRPVLIVVDPCAAFADDRMIQGSHYSDIKCLIRLQSFT